jgi:hypothetical protein
MEFIKMVKIAKIAKKNAKNAQELETAKNAITAQLTTSYKELNVKTTATKDGFQMTMVSVFNVLTPLTVLDAIGEIQTLAMIVSLLIN